MTTKKVERRITRYMAHYVRNIRMSELNAMSKMQILRRTNTTVITVKIPVIGNGDILTGQDAIRMFEQTGCDAVMIGRGARGNPWIFSQVGRYLKDQTVLAPPTTKEICDMILRHAKMLIEAKGEYTGIREMRKHFAWYTAGMKHSAALRGRVNQVEHFEELEQLVDMVHGADETK